MGRTTLAATHCQRTGAPRVPGHRPAWRGTPTLALRFAQAIDCTQPPAPGVSCGTCRMCTHLERMQQTDMSIVQAEEAGSTIKVDQVRDLQHSLSLMPYEASYRTAFLLNFQDATESAQNALLKTLEEAPSRVILFVTADAAENLLPTIVSRCEVMRLRPMALQQTRRHPAKRLVIARR